MLETITAVNQAVNSFIWGVPAMVCIIGVGLLLSVRTGFLQIRKFPYTIKTTIGRMFRKKDASDGAITPFQAVCTALAGTVGTGNIAGVAGAIAIGGPGAVFWMWCSALLGMCTKFAEVTLAVHFRERSETGEWVGGPMYYIKNGLGKRWQFLAFLYSLFGVLTVFGTGNATQVNTIVAAVDTALLEYGVVGSGFLSTLNLIAGIIVAMLVAMVLLGGIKRIGSVSEKLVPVMALLWCQSAAPTGADELASAYSALFYSLPIINTILMPLAMAILASRLWDVEVKGCTPKLLYTLQSRRSLFAAKAALGLAEIFLIVTLEAAGAPLIGHLQHYTQPYPAAGQAAYLWGCTFAVDCMIFFSELLLTVLLANPLPALCVGILGTLLGLFSAFMPAWVGYFVPWGYFIPLNTYRIADWDQASKVVTYMIVPFQWPLLVATVVLAGILFFAAWYAMRNKEV